MSSAEEYVSTDDGVRLFCQTIGGGADWTLIPNGFHLLDDVARLADGRTLVFYDVRNRGKSDAVADPAKIERGILNDVDDIECVRRHFKIPRVNLIAHSYVGITAALCARRFPAHVRRVVQIAPMQPNHTKTYSPELMNADDVLHETIARLGRLEQERSTTDPREFCEKFWSILTPIYVADPADGHKVKWSRCDLPNERQFMKYWLGQVIPSIQKLTLTAEDFRSATAPVLIVHGRKDRSAPYGGGLDWAQMLPNARLLTVDHAAHAPWIDAPDLVLGAIDTFLRGDWPSAATSHL